jgi:hypothetical protein
MKRRGLLKLTGAVVAGGSFTLGTGAFTSTSASRSVDIAVADDDEAFLSLNDISGTGRSGSYNDPGQIVFEIPGDYENTIGDGVGQNSTYEFGSLLEIRNQGDDTVTVWSRSPSSGGIESVYLTGPESVLKTKSDGRTLTPGESFVAGLLIETGEGTGWSRVDLTIRAEKPGADGFPEPNG